MLYLKTTAVMYLLLWMITPMIHAQGFRPHIEQTNTVMFAANCERPDGGYDAFTLEYYGNAILSAFNGRDYGWIKAQYIATNYWWEGKSTTTYLDNGRPVTFFVAPNARTSNNFPAGVTTYSDDPNDVGSAWWPGGWELIAYYWRDGRKFGCYSVYWTQFLPAVSFQFNTEKRLPLITDSWSVGSEMISAMGSSSSGRGKFNTPYGGNGCWCWNGNQCCEAETNVKIQRAYLEGSEYQWSGLLETVLGTHIDKRSWRATYNHICATGDDINSEPNANSTDSAGINFNVTSPVDIDRQSVSNVNSTINPTSSNTTTPSQQPQVRNLPCYNQVMYIPASGTLKAIIGPFRSKDKLVTTQSGYESGNYPSISYTARGEYPKSNCDATANGSGVALSLLATFVQLMPHWYGGKEVASGIASSLFATGSTVANGMLAWCSNE
jgi:hypothetical protein